MPKADGKMPSGIVTPGTKIGSPGAGKRGKAAGVAPSARLSPRQRSAVRESLLLMRQRIRGQMTSLKHDTLDRADTALTVEDGTDAFDRQLALDLAGWEQERVVDIDDALLRIKDKTYGVCEQCGEVIGKERLDALPFVRMCIGCQREIETGKTSPREARRGKRPA